MSVLMSLGRQSTTINWVVFIKVYSLGVLGFIAYEMVAVHASLSFQENTNYPYDLLKVALVAQ